MDPNQANVRKKLLLRILANYKKKEIKKKKKICERKGKQKQKKSVYTENPIPILIFDCVLLRSI